MDAFLENAQRLFEVARTDDSAEPNDFALLIRPDGGLQLVMETSRVETAMLENPSESAYRVTKTAGSVRVVGRDGNQECILEQHSRSRQKSSRRFSNELLRDQPLYWITSPLTVSAGP